VVILLIAVFLEVYTTHRISSELKNEGWKIVCLKTIGESPILHSSSFILH
jgi:hypothetical protein